MSFNFLASSTPEQTSPEYVHAKVAKPLSQIHLTGNQLAPRRATFMQPINGGVKAKL